MMLMRLLIIVAVGLLALQSHAGHKGTSHISLQAMTSSGAHPCAHKSMNGSRMTCQNSAIYGALVQCVVAIYVLFHTYSLLLFTYLMRMVAGIRTPIYRPPLFS